MKIGVITFHSVVNYGSALQAFAMQEGIAKCGVETELIDYRPEMKQTKFIERVFNNRRRLLSVNKWKRFITSKINSRKLYYINDDRSSRRAAKFTEFQNNNFRLSETVKSNEELRLLESQYDACVCGSDQVWNPTYIGHDTSYFLDFVSDDKKRIAYAPSIAVLSYPTEYEEDYASQMKRFIKISVREAESLNLVRQLTGIEAKIVVDPTLLLEREDWEKIEIAPSDAYIDEPYIFCYFLGANNEYCEYVNRLKALTGLKVLVVTCTELKLFKDFGDIVCDDIGPSEFIYLIHHADYICTDSFHGTVFSIINERPFFTFKRYQDRSKTSENSRVYTLLDMIEHKERLIENVDDINRLYKQKLDYINIKRNIRMKRIESVDFLNEEIRRVKSSL